MKKLFLFFSLILTFSLTQPAHAKVDLLKLGFILAAMQPLSKIFSGYFKSSSSTPSTPPSIPSAAVLDDDPNVYVNPPVVSPTTDSQDCVKLKVAKNACSYLDGDAGYTTTCVNPDAQSGGSSIPSGSGRRSGTSN